MSCAVQAERTVLHEIKEVLLEILAGIEKSLSVLEMFFSYSRFYTIYYADIAFLLCRATGKFMEQVY